MGECLDRFARWLEAWPSCRIATTNSSSIHVKQLAPLRSVIGLTLGSSMPSWNSSSVYMPYLTKFTGHMDTEDLWKWCNVTYPCFSNMPPLGFDNWVAKQCFSAKAPRANTVLRCSSRPLRRTRATWPGRRAACTYVQRMGNRSPHSVSWRSCCRSPWSRFPAAAPKASTERRADRVGAAGKETFVVYLCFSPIGSFSKTLAMQLPYSYTGGRAHSP